MSLLQEYMEPCQLLEKKRVPEFDRRKDFPGHQRRGRCAYPGAGQLPGQSGDGGGVGAARKKIFAGIAVGFMVREYHGYSGYGKTKSFGEVNVT